MNALPLAEEENINRFIDSLNFRTRSSVPVYRCILRGFVRFSLDRLSDQAEPEGILNSWLQDRANHWPSHMVEHRARIVQRFLSRMKTRAYKQQSPFAALENQYGKQTAPIVRALLSTDSKAALDSLRPRVRFNSFLGTQMREHLDFMRSLGHRYDTEEHFLDRFDRFLQNRLDLIDQPLSVLINAYRQVRPSVHHAVEAQRCGRILSKAAHRHDPSVAIFPTDRQLWREARARHRRPYIYTLEEVAKLLDTAQSLPSPLCPLRPHSVYTMLVLAFCAGLRLGEIANLTMGDVNLDDGTIEIRETKFYKYAGLRAMPMRAAVNYADTANSWTRAKCNSHLPRHSYRPSRNVRSLPCGRYRPVLLA